MPRQPSELEKLLIAAGKSPAEARRAVEDALSERRRSMWNRLVSSVPTVITVLTILSPVLWFVVARGDAAAQDYVNKIIAPPLTAQTQQIEELADKVDDAAVLAAESAEKATVAADQTQELVDKVESLSATLSTLVRGQAQETTQSQGEAAVNQRLLCIIESMAAGQEPSCPEVPEQP